MIQYYTHGFVQTKKCHFFDPHPYRVVAINGSMITAQRSNHQVTRNTRHFKVISEVCYETAINLNSFKHNNSNVKLITFPLEEQSPLVQQHTLCTDTNLQITPPPTPMVEVE